MYSFSYLEPVCCSMSSSNCCFLTCIQISQEAGQVVCYSHLFQNFPQFIVIHTVKGFGIVSKSEIDISLELSCFFDDPEGVGNLISCSSAFSKISLNIWKFTVHVLLKLAWRILSITLLACEMSAIVQQFEHSLVLPFSISIIPQFFKKRSHWAAKVALRTEASANLTVFCEARMAFSTLTILCHFPLTCMISDEKSTIRICLSLEGLP